MNPNEAAYWVEDANGNLMVYNGTGQYLDAVSKNHAGDFIARFNQGQRDMTVDYRPGADTGSSTGGSNGPAWANVGLRGREIDIGHQQFGDRMAEDRRQFDARLDQDASQFNARHGLEEATQRWREAVDKRDFEAANFWKSRAQELQQNSLALDYTKHLSSLSGPQDWIKYGRLSRQESPLGTPDGQTVPLDKALPEWARGVTPGTYGYGPETQPSRGFPGMSSGGPGVGGPSASAPAPVASQPKWTQAAPGWQQPNGTTVAPTLKDLVAHTSPNAPAGTFAGQNGTPIYMSEWSKKQLGA